MIEVELKELNNEYAVTTIVMNSIIKMLELVVEI